MILGCEARHTGYHRDPLDAPHEFFASGCCYEHGLAQKRKRDQDWGPIPPDIEDRYRLRLLAQETLLVKAGLLIPRLRREDGEE